MEIFVVNLDRETGRLSWMADLLESNSLKWRRFPAVDMNELSDAMVSEFVDPAANTLTKGEIACFLSHIGVWKQIVEGEGKYAAILEDDVFLSVDAHHFLGNSAWIPPHVDLIKVETTQSPIYLGGAVANVLSHQILKLDGFHNGSAGYIISKRYAAALLAELTQIDRPVDDFIFDLNVKKCWQLSPALCIQHMFLPQDGTIKSSLEDGRLKSRGATRFKPPRSLLSRVSKEARRFLRWAMRKRRQRVPMGAIRRL